MKKTSKYLTTHARHDKSCCLAPGVFRSLQPGERSKPLDVKYTVGSRTLRFRNPERLGADDLRVLQSVVANASIQQFTFNPSEAKSADARLLASVIKGTLTDDGEALIYCAVKTTVYRLCKELGIEPGGFQRKNLINCLERMSNGTIGANDDNRRYTMDFLGYCFVKDTDEIIIAVNPLVASAVLRESKGFVHVDMNEVRALAGDAARILHQRLCAVIDPGKRRAFLPDTLIEYVWPEEATPATQRKRHSRLIKALEEVASLKGWSYAKKEGKYVICRGPVYK